MLCWRKRGVGLAVGVLTAATNEMTGKMIVTNHRAGSCQLAPPMLVWVWSVYSVSLKEMNNV